MKSKWIKLFCILGMAAAMSGCASGKDLEYQMMDDKYRTFYEVFVYSFYDSNGDGVGDLKGLTDKLDYINDGNPATSTDLGCNGIWLMPVMPSTTYHKYDVTDYYDIDPEYGTMEDFDAFVSACKKRDIHVLMDLVINHTSSEHPWFTQAVAYLKGLGDKEPSTEDCPYFEYYHFAKEKKSGTWYQVAGTEWYYEAVFWSKMPDLNLDSNAVRGEIEKITGFWLDKGITGFRLDAAKEYVSDNTTANIEILKWFNTMVKEQKEDAYIVAEIWTDASTYAKYYASGIDSTFDFQFASQDGMIASALNRTKGNNAVAYGKVIGQINELFSQYNEEYIDAPFYTNHDMGRSAGYYAGDGSMEKTKIAQAMNLLMSGNAFLYYGEELGMKGSGKDENKRAPMQWFSDVTAEGMCRGPQDMDSIKMKYGDLQQQSQDQASIYQYVKDVIRIRNAFPEIARGITEYLELYSDDQVCVLKKTYDGSELLLIYNLSADQKELSKNDILVNEQNLSELTARVVLLAGEEKTVETVESMVLPPYSVVIYQ
ncbi:MAG TPA: alpha-amylase family glycosyl hydrolase [Lachnospiraceae bacterium]|nr:alpha-amylase family glycosyl hydrolase [Lachnospiraceae bacterium]